MRCLRSPALLALVTSLLVVMTLAPSAATAFTLGVGGEVAFIDADHVLLANSDGGNVVPLADRNLPVGNPGVTSDEPRWAPGGGDLAYSSGGGALSVLSSGVEIGPVDSDWAWSPDGDAIAWVSPAGANDLWVTAVASGASWNLTGGAVSAHSPQWLPHGRTIVFEGAGAIWTVPSSGGPMTQLATGHAPVVSHGGNRVAYLAETGSEPRVLSTIGVDGKGATIVATITEPCAFRPALWSPDDSKLGYGVACGSPVTGSIEFYVVPAAGGQPTKVGGGSAFRARGPIWSPAGDRLALVEGGWSTLNVTIVAPDGTSPLALTGLFAPGSCTAAPSWSPDGFRLAFEAYVSGCEQQAVPPAPPSGVYVVNRNGSGLVSIGSGARPAWRPPPYHFGLLDPTQGVWHLNGIASFYYGNPGDVGFLGDWNGDGVATPGLYRQSDGFVYLRNSNTQGIADIRFFFGNPGDTPLAGDFNGDGRDTVSIYRPSTGEVFIINSLGKDGGGLGAAEYSYYFGNPGDKPFVGDFNGDGIDTVGLHRESTGLVYLRNSHTQGPAELEFYFGNPGDWLVAGDWNGDGVDTVGVFRPSTRTFHLRLHNTQGIADVSFVVGRSWWLPVAGPLGG